MNFTYRSAVLIALLFASFAFTGCSGCTSSYSNIPPNDIGMMLTPTGYENKIYTPGQIDLGKDDIDGKGNRLVLIQRSAIQVKEQFIGREASPDKEDHRCLTGKKEPVTLDVRILLALPNYETPEGKKDIARIFHLGNPATEKTDAKVLRISAESIYNEQAQQQVRGKIRQIVSQYPHFDDVLAAFANEGANGLGNRIQTIVATALKEQAIPLRVVSVVPSNLKPDPSLIDAIAAQQAAEKRVEAIRTITNFLSADTSGARTKVYKMQVLQEIVAKANANGHNTIFMTDIGSDLQVVPLPKFK